MKQSFCQGFKTIGSSVINRICHLLQASQILGTFCSCLNQTSFDLLQAKHISNFQLSYGQIQRRYQNVHTWKQIHYTSTNLTEAQNCGVVLETERQLQLDFVFFGFFSSLWTGDGRGDVASTLEFRLLDYFKHLNWCSVTLTARNKKGNWCSVLGAKSQPVTLQDDTHFII